MQKNSGPKIFVLENFSLVLKSLGQKLLVLKKICPQNFTYKNKSEEIFGPEKFWLPKRFLRPKNFLAPPILQARTCQIFSKAGYIRLRHSVISIPEEFKVQF